MVSPPPPPPGATGGPPPADSVIGNAGFSLLAQLLTSVFTAGLTLFLARYLGADRYGIFALAVSISALVILPVDFGIAASTGRFLADRRGDLVMVRALLADALALKLVLSIPACLVLAALAGPIASAFDTPGLVWPLRGVAIAVLGQSVLLLYQGTFAAMGLLRLQFRVQAVESAVETGASVVFVVLGAGAGGAAFGRGAGYLVGAVFAVAVTTRVLGRDVLPRRLGGGERMRMISAYAWPLFLVNGAFTLFEQIDILLIGAIESAGSAGLFQAPLRLATFLHYPGLAVANAVAPRMVGDDPATARRRLQAALRGLILLDTAFVPPLLVWAEPITRLTLGREYAGSAPVLRTLTPFVFLLGLAPLVSLAVSYVGQARRRVPVAIATVAINAAIDAVLIPRMGIIGAAVGTDVAFAVYVAAHVLICRREFGIDLRPLGLTSVRAGLAGAAMAGVLVLAGIRDLTAREWIVGGTAGLAAYAAVLAVTREVGADDIRAVRASLRRRRSGAAP
ncbi:MAG: hypothetical protein QOG43_2251 [Actinomycetota bacterium]|nr:hypothetical protein [Actinomycetota bacterium]